MPNCGSAISFWLHLSQKIWPHARPEKDPLYKKNNLAILQTYSGVCDSEGGMRNDIWS